MNKSDSSGRSSARAASQLRRLEQSLHDPTVRRDSEYLRQLLADDFLEFGSSGKIWTRRSIIDMLAGETNFQPPGIEELQVNFLADKVALITYRTVRTDPKSGEQICTSLRSSIWTRQDREWRMRFHQGTRAS